MASKSTKNLPCHHYQSWNLKPLQKQHIFLFKQPKTCLTRIPSRPLNKASRLQWLFIATVMKPVTRASFQLSFSKKLHLNLSYETPDTINLPNIPHDAKCVEKCPVLLDFSKFPLSLISYLFNNFLHLFHTLDSLSLDIHQYSPKFLVKNML